VGRSGDRGQMAVSCRLIGWLWSPVATPATRIGCLFPASLSCVLNPTLDAVDRRCHRHGRCGCPMRLMVFRRHHHYAQEGNLRRRAVAGSGEHWSTTDRCCDRLRRDGGG
jgi:hypothetical protein